MPIACQNSGSPSARPTPRAMEFRLPLLLPASILGLACLGHATGDWAVFAGVPGGTGSVITVDPTGAVTALPELAGAVLVDLDFVGRTRLERFLPDRPRQEPLPGGVSRLALPQQRGSLYAYRRPLPGPDRFGLFAVAPDGGVRLLLDRPGVGAEGDLPPFSPRLAVSPDGAALLVATALAAGGDLLEIEVGSGATHDRTAGLPPTEFLVDGLGLRATWGVGLTASGPLRFPRVAAAVATAVPFDGPPPAWCGPGVVFSGAGLTAGFVAGASADAARVYTCGPAGPARAATMPSAALDGAGFAPTAADGPWLALSTDGALVGYRTREPLPGGGLTREVWVARTLPGPAAQHLSSDSSFLDTIDEIGLLRFVPGGALLFGAGEVGDGAPPGLDRMDLYLAVPGGAAPAIVNLTLSSGDAAAPFTAPAALAPEDGLYLLPGTEIVVLHDGGGSVGRLLGANAATGQVATLLDGVKSLDEATWTGSSLILSVRREGDAKRRELLRVHPSAGLTVLAGLPEGTEFLGLRAGPEGTVAAVLTLGLAQWLARLDPASGAAALLTPVPVAWSTVLAWSEAGAIGASLAPGPGPGLHVDWPLAGPPLPIPAPPPTGHLLPGL
jgi:hypothetical protein